MQRISIGYQLYSAREAAKADLPGVCKRLGQIGYDGVEFAGFFGRGAQEIKRILEDAGLAAASSHVPFQSIVSDPFGTIAYHQAIGCPRVAIPSLDAAHRPGGPAFPEAIRLIAWFGRLCREAGIQLLYHNHDFEFVTLSGQYGLDFLYAAIDPDLLKTEIDVCWVNYAGVNPVEYLRKYAGRAPVVHMKDFVGSRGEGTPYALLGQAQGADARAAFAYKPFGQGCQDTAALAQAGRDAGAEWFVVEQDEWYDHDPLDDAQTSLETLRRLGV